MYQYSNARLGRRAGVAAATTLMAVGALVPVGVGGPAGWAEAAVAGLPADQTVSDFDGDGINDLAMAALRRGTSDHVVIVDYSSDLPTMESDPRESFGFGVGLASGDLNQDGFDDLVVGCIDCGDDWDRATVWISYGSANGLKPLELKEGNPQNRVAIGELDDADGLSVGSTRAGEYAAISFLTAPNEWSHRQVLVDLSVPSDHRLLGAVAIGDVNGDGKDDLVVGSPTATGGSVTLFPGPVTADNQHSVQVKLAHLGTALAVADLNGDGASDIVAGAPEALVGGKVSGAIAVLRGASSGISASRMQVVHQGSANVPGGAESGDLWGTSVATGNIDSDSKPEVLVGAPGEDVGSASAAGAYTVLQPSTAGVTGIGAFRVNQDSPNVPGKVEAGDQFGRAIVVRDRTGDGRPDVLIGSPGEDISTTRDAGLVAINYSSSTGRPASGSFYVSGRRYGESRLGWNLG